MRYGKMKVASKNSIEKKKMQAFGGMKIKERSSFKNNKPLYRKHQRTQTLHDKRSDIPLYQDRSTP